jgi:hypothetical protein
MTDTWHFFSPPKSRSDWRSFAGPEHDVPRVRFQRPGPVTEDGTKMLVGDGDMGARSTETMSLARSLNGTLPVYALLNGSGMAMGWMARTGECLHAVKTAPSRPTSIDVDGRNAREINANLFAHKYQVPNLRPSVLLHGRVEHTLDQITSVSVLPTSAEQSRPRFGFEQPWDLSTPETESESIRDGRAGDFGIIGQERALSTRVNRL